MSHPGAPGRVQHYATGPVEAVTLAAELVGQLQGARSFELRYEALNRSLADGEEPTTEDRVRWEAVAVIRCKHGKHRVDTTYIGSSVVEPGGSNSRGMSLAAVDLLEQLGANTVVIDMTDDTDPREGGR
jgi:hypothetical protein